MSLHVQERRSRVPVEHRFLGLDKRSFPVAFFVIAVFLLLTVAIPLVDKAIDWDDPARPGDELALSDAITFTPTTGWEVTTGFRAPASGAPDRSGPATVTSGGVTVSVVPGKFDSTPAALLEQIQKVTSATDDPTFRIADDPTTLTTTSGEVGVLQTYSSVRGDGLVAAFVIGETGVEITAYGPPEAMTTLAPDIRAMITSIRSTGAEGSGS
ncbi:hypothetical protein ACFJIY_09715 [Pimelobacter simplex]|uniref:hypothetical protein n=1 Tax=Nocardioides simplex TaxID=2045 RepID=UPI00366ECCBC